MQQQQQAQMCAAMNQQVQSQAQAASVAAYRGTSAESAFSFPGSSTNTCDQSGARWIFVWWNECPSCGCISRQCNIKPKLSSAMRPCIISTKCSSRSAIGAARARNGMQTGTGHCQFSWYITSDFTWDTNTVATASTPTASRSKSRVLLF
jgi:hypothetical protein